MEANLMNNEIKNTTDILQEYINYIKDDSKVKKYQLALIDLIIY